MDGAARRLLGDPMPLDAPNAQDNPFRITPNPRFVYAGQLDAAIGGVRAAVVDGRDAAILAEPGMGKTLALRLLAQACEAGFDVRFAAAGPGFDPAPLFAPTTRPATLILVDDAHALAPRELRGLWSRIEASRSEGRRASLVLAGRPRLEPAAAEAELRLDRFCLSSLPGAAIPALVRRRLAQAGLAADAFSSEALGELARRSRGVPRVLNLACSNTLFRAQGEQAEQATIEHARAAAEALELPEPPAEAQDEEALPPAPPGTLIGLAGVAMSDGGPRAERQGWKTLASGLALFATGLAGLILLSAHAPTEDAQSVRLPPAIAPAVAAPRFASNSVREPLQKESASAPSAVVHYSAFDPAAERAARRAAEALGAVGVTTQDIRAVRARFSSTSVRYFHEADRDDAARVNGAVAAALLRSGFDRARLQDLTHYEPRPREGALEVWVGRGPPPAAPRAVRRIGAPARVLERVRQDP